MTTTLCASGTLTYMGYHTVTLPSAVGLTGGQPFAVAVKVTSPGATYPIAIEEPIAGHSDAATAQAGQSHVSPTGSRWTDLTTISDFTEDNVCLKAFTGLPAAPTVAGFTPTSGPVGTVVTLTGTQFTGATAVAFHGTAAVTYIVGSATQITATVPAGATTGTIAVTTPGGAGHNGDGQRAPAPWSEESTRTASGLVGVTMDGTLRTCGTCQFWYATKESGECHRYPPQVVLNGATPVAQPHTHFPVLPPNAVGCGEHWATERTAAWTPRLGSSSS